MKRSPKGRTDPVLTHSKGTPVNSRENNDDVHISDLVTHDKDPKLEDDV